MSSQNIYHLHLSEDNKHHHILWFVQNRYCNFLSLKERLEVMDRFASWVESLALNGTTKRLFHDNGHIRNIMELSDPKDYLIIKLAFDSKMFE